MEIWREFNDKKNLNQMKWATLSRFQLCSSWGASWDERYQNYLNHLIKRLECFTKIKRCIQT